MKKYLLLLLFFCPLLIVSCKKSEEINPLSNMSIVFSDNNHPVRGKVKYDYNLDNCGQINLITSVKESDGTYSQLKLTLLSNGALAKVQYFKQNSSADGNYFAPHLQPEKSFQIADFKYEKAGGRLSFSFRGKVYKNNEQERVLTGKVDLHTIKYAPCEALILDVMTVKPAFNFFSMYSSSTKSTVNPDRSDQYNYYTYVAHSNSGQFISLKLESDISKLVGQEIDFDDTNPLYSVKYWEYTGLFMLEESYGSLDQNWKRFQTRGKFTSIQKVSDERYNKPYYKGIIVMDILDEGRLVKESVEIPFYMSSMD